MQIGDRIHRVGGAYVSFYVIEDGGRLTVVDAGLPGYWDDLDRLIGQNGWSLIDIEAVLLTHAHQDHIGLAERLRTEADAEVRVHADDVSMARGEVKTAVPRLPFWHPHLLRTAFAGVRAGMLKVPPVAVVSTFADGEVLDLPGRPRVIHTPGHTAGSCAIYAEERGTLFAGDALATVDIVTGRPGPRIPPKAVNADSEQALSSLDRLDGIEADVLLVGHGEPWTDGLPPALAAARAVGIT
jgi:glyoxylase-like metal-dependent hydrolase (beta-lactamase superfamily II)